MARDFLIERIRESYLRLNNTSERITEPYQKAEVDLHDSIRDLSRNRVSHFLRQLRAADGHSYEVVNANTGLSQQLLFDVEFKDRRLTLDELRRLAAFYEISIGDILGIEIE